VFDKYPNIVYFNKTNILFFVKPRVTWLAKVSIDGSKRVTHILELL